MSSVVPASCSNRGLLREVGRVLRGPRWVPVYRDARGVDVGARGRDLVVAPPLVARVEEGRARDPARLCRALRWSSPWWRRSATRRPWAAPATAHLRPSTWPVDPKTGQVDPKTGQNDPGTPPSRRPEPAPAVSARVLQVIDRVLSEAIEGVSTSLRHAALIDPLTGCANRRGLEEDLERAMAGANRTGLDVALTVIDLDGLKQINDTNGHAAGDASSRDLADCLRSVVRETDTVYRVGGDEFVVLMPFSGTVAAARTMQMARALGAPSFSWGRRA